MKLEEALRESSGVLVEVWFDSGADNLLTKLWSIIDEADAFPGPGTGTPVPWIQMIERNSSAAPGRPVRTIRDHLRHAFDRPAFEVLLAVLIVLSVGLTFLEVAMDPRLPAHPQVVLAGELLTALFVVELTLRWLVASSTSRFLSLYWVDMLAVIPVLRSLRILRILRILRLVRLGHILNRRLRSLRLTLFTAAPEYTLVAASVAVVVMVATLTIHWVESGINPQFDTVEKSFWWSVFSLMAAEPTAGEPATRAGRFVAATVMLSGLTLFAVLTGVVSASVIETLRRRTNVNTADLETLNDHVVIAGYNRSLPVLLSELQADPTFHQSPVVIVGEGIDRDQISALDANQDLLHVCPADYTRVDVLRRVGIERARMCILLSDNTIPRSDQDRDARTLLAAMLIEKLHSGIFTCAQLLNPENEAHLKMVGVEEVILADQYAGTIMAAAGRARGIVSLVREVFSTHHGNQIYRIAVHATWIGRALEDALHRTKSRSNVLIICVDSRSQGKLLVNPPGDYRFGDGDELLVLSREDPGCLTGTRSLDRVFEGPDR